MSLSRARSSVPLRLLGGLAFVAALVTACGDDDAVPASGTTGKSGASGASGAGAAGKGGAAGKAGGAGTSAGGASAGTGGASAGAGGTAAAGSAGTTAGGGGSSGASAGAGGAAGTRPGGFGGSGTIGGTGGTAGTGGSAGTAAGGTSAGGSSAAGAAGTSAGGTSAGGSSAAGAAGTSAAGAAGSGPVNRCNDFVDDNKDGALACANTNCDKDPACASTGPRVTGSTCETHTQCKPHTDAPACLPDGTGGHTIPGGYCSDWCNPNGLPAERACEPGATCVDATVFFPDFKFAAAKDGLCTKTCAKASDCPAFFVCNNAKACVPAPKEKCVGGIDENNDGKVDCEDASCAAHPACTGGEKSCADFIDEDENGLFDCKDPKCKETAACKPGQNGPGQVCAVSSDCVAAEGDPLCFVPGAAFPGGYCSEWCDVGKPASCAPGATCVSAKPYLPEDAVIPAGSGICLESCGNVADCRLGYSCQQGRCERAPAENCLLPGDEDHDGLTNCADPDCKGKGTCPP